MGRGGSWTLGPGSSGRAVFRRVAFMVFWVVIFALIDIDIYYVSGADESNVTPGVTSI